MIPQTKDESYKAKKDALRTLKKLKKVYIPINKFKPKTIILVDESIDDQMAIKKFLKRNKINY